MGYNSNILKIFFSYTQTRIHTYTHTFEFMLYLWRPSIYFRQLFFTVQQYGSEWIAVLSLKGMENKNIYILRKKKQ